MSKGVNVQRCKGFLYKASYASLYKILSIFLGIKFAIKWYEK